LYGVQEAGSSNLLTQTKKRPMITEKIVGLLFSQIAKNGRKWHSTVNAIVYILPLE
jgi:hypothetical protein